MSLEEPFAETEPVPRAGRRRRPADVGLTKGDRLRRAMRSRQALRQAYLLHEVLGPPLGLRPRHLEER